MTPRAAKRRRTSRAGRPVVVLTDRDAQILGLIGLCKFASADQVARTFFPSADRARRRLRLLFDAGYIALALLSSTSPNLVSLTKSGIEAVAARDPGLASRLKLSGPIRLAAIDHHLGTVDTRLFCVALGETLVRPLLRWGGSQSELAREHQLGSVSLEPDGLAEFGTADETTTITLAVEFDTGTESHRVLQSKFERYGKAREKDLLDGLLFVARGGQGRLESVCKLRDDHGLASFTAVLGDEEVVSRPLRVPSSLRQLLSCPITGRDESANDQSIGGVQTPKYTHDRPPDRRVDR